MLTINHDGILAVSKIADRAVVAFITDVTKLIRYSISLKLFGNGNHSSDFLEHEELKKHYKQFAGSVAADLFRLNKIAIAKKQLPPLVDECGHPVQSAKQSDVIRAVLEYFKESEFGI